MDLEKKAIDRLRHASEMSLRLYGLPLVITYSGGKDSDVLLHLTRKSGIPFEALHSLTTADAPPTVQHVREVFRALELDGIRCTVDKHVRPDGSRTTMWNLIPRNLMPPTRLVRYCCSELKEGGGKGRFIATGVRWDESTARKNNLGSLEVIARKRKDSLILSNDNDADRREFEICKMQGKRVVNPIVDWTTEDVLDYIAAERIAMNPLYACGFTRVGCVGCPMASRARAAEFAMFPQFKAAYIRAFDRMLAVRKALGKNTYSWQTGVDVYHWWMEEDVLPGQEVLEGFEV